MKNEKTRMSQIILKTNRMTLIFILSVLFPLMTSCKDPYAIKTGSIDYSGPQTKAAIQFSDPQLYKREALINERRDELKYLNQLLLESRTQNFEPELMRELEMISAFSASIGVKFDPAAEINFDRAVELGNLEQEIQTTKLQFQLSQLKRDLELLENQLAEQEKPSETEISGDSEVTPAPAGPTPPSKEEIDEIVKRLDALVKSAVTRLDKKTEALRKSEAKSSPRNLFLDRQAYRNDIRNAINSVSLDELHDYQGNSLYRMQFQATVLPGVDLDKLGILRMKLASPQYDENDPDDQKILEDLYLKWLGHLTRRLNQIDHAGEIRPNQVALQLGATGVYFDILEYQIPRPGNKTCKPEVIIGAPDNTNCQIIRIAIPPGTADDIAENYHTIKQSQQGHSNHVKNALRYSLTELRSPTSAQYALTTGCQDFLTEYEITGGSGFTNQQIFQIARSVLEADSAMIQSIGYQAELGALPKQDRERIVSMMTEVIKDLKTTLNEFVPISKQIISELRTRNPDCLNMLPETQRTRRLVRGVPSDFKSAMLTVQADGKSKYKGRISVYAASPIELVQRVSSVAQAANALEFAGALAATLPAKGVGAEGTLGYTRSATGKVDAMERVPLVVGFSESINSDAGNKQTPGFGWLLGPEVTLNPENQTLELEHRIAPYSLTADVSIPSWWPYLPITSQSAWAPNWQNKNETILDETLVNKKTIPVPIRHNSADLDNITGLMVARFSGQLMEIAEIERIEPSIVSRCAGSVTFLIRGMNLWRGSEVYLMGQKGTDVKVLPDMAGISVTFDIGALPQPSSAATKKESTLTVWTRNGVATTEVLITGEKSNANECVDNPPEKPAADNGKPSVTTVLPNEISVCDSSPHFIVKGKNLKTVKSVYLGTLKADTFKEADPKNGTLIEVKFDKRIADKAKAITKLPLIIRTSVGVASSDVKITYADCK